MTKAEIRAEVFRRLNESASAPVFWTVADVDEAIDEGYMAMSDAAEWYETYVSLPLLAGRPYYDLRTVVGSDFLAVGRAFDVQTNRWLIPVSIREFDAHDRRWEFVTGEPQRIMVRGLWWLGLWPRIQADTGTLKQYYTALPPAMAEDDDEPGFPDQFQNGLVEFALTDLWAQDGETARAVQAWTVYLAVEADLVAWMRGRAGAAQVHGYGSAASVPR